MNKSVSNSTIKRLIERLFLSNLLEINQVDSSEILHSLALDDEDIADSIWLALQMGVVEQPPKSITPEQEIDNKIIDDGVVKSLSTSPQQDDVVNVYTNNQEKNNNLVESKQKQTTPTAGFPFQVPAAPTIQNSLEIGRMMRPLKRKFPSATKVVLDEEATVTRIIERDIWLPVTKPKPERWLDLELVVEESRSCFIWQEMIDEFQKILENHGAFASVRVWAIKSQSQQNLILTRRRKRNNLEQRQHKHRELIHPNKRGLTLLISDCVSPLWENKTIYEWLKDWSEGQPTALVQLFPERLWESTHLSLGRKLFANALNPGVTNPKLVLENLPIWLPINWHDTLVLPVLNLEPQIVKPWAGVIASLGNASISTYLFDLNFIKEIEPQAKEDHNKSTEHISPEAQEEQAKIIVKRFLATASLTAQRLVGMMAAAPVDMSVVNLIRKNCLPEAQPVHVAEVYMGGLLHAIEEDTQAKPRVYDFLPSVRKVLNQAMAINETEGVLDAISQYIGDQLDKSIHSFTALIASLPEYSEIDQEKVLPFAQIAVDVFRNIGGEYTDFAKKVSENLQRTLSPPDKPEDPIFVPFDFQVALIEILKTQTFNFVVATLKRESKRRFWGLFGEETSLVIKRQQQQGIGIIEELSEGVNLELMEIPEGTFLMGSPNNEQDRFSSEGPQHQVTVPALFMGKYPVTQAQWKFVAGLPEVNRELKPDPSRFKGANRPVEGVSWYDAVEFCDRLSQHIGKSYRLPSEAEWEYACRAGTTTPFHFGETITSDLANYTYGSGEKGTYREETTVVGSFTAANAFGLYDMHGNVWEWCLDDWHDNYKGAPTDGSAWFDHNDNLSQKQGNTVLRGGSWIDFPDSCRSASRSLNTGVGRGGISYVIGFRVVCAVGRII